MPALPETITIYHRLQRLKRPKHRNDRSLVNLRENLHTNLKALKEERWEEDFSQVEILLREFDRIAQERTYQGRLRRYARCVDALSEACTALLKIEQEPIISVPA